jgi:hypothetical protein
MGICTLMNQLLPFADEWAYLSVAVALARVLALSYFAIGPA